MQILVLGMRRAGTSTLARLLNLMGALFGLECGSSGASAENPMGFWERRHVGHITDAAYQCVRRERHITSELQKIEFFPLPIGHFETASRNLILNMDAHRSRFLKELLPPFDRKKLLELQGSG